MRTASYWSIVPPQPWQTFIPIGKNIRKLLSESGDTNFRPFSNERPPVRAPGSLNFGTRECSKPKSQVMGRECKKLLTVLICTVQYMQLKSINYSILRRNLFITECLTNDNSNHCRCSRICFLAAETSNQRTYIPNSRQADIQCKFRDKSTDFGTLVQFSGPYFSIFFHAFIFVL
jgi:hypothetical protein